jgi:hypothetical protein
MKLLILGATGLVGQSPMVQAVTHPAITQVGKLRCFLIQQASAEGFGRVGNPKLHPLRDL